MRSAVVSLATLRIADAQDVFLPARQLRGSANITGDVVADQVAMGDGENVTRFELEAASAASSPHPNGYHCYTQTNCYAGHGADDLDDVHLYQGAPLEACTAACGNSIYCDGIVYMHSQSKCWRRRNIYLPQCEKGHWGQESAEFTTCVQVGSAPAPTTLAPTPAPAPVGAPAPPAPAPPPLPCSDNNQKCGDWAAIGECGANPGWMLLNCAQSCGACSSAPTRAPQPTPGPVQKPSGWCSRFDASGWSPGDCRKAYGGGWYQWICTVRGTTYFCSSDCAVCQT